MSIHGVEKKKKEGREETRVKDKLLEIGWTTTSVLLVLQWHSLLRVTNFSVRWNRSTSMEVKFCPFVTTLACNLATRKLSATVELSSGKAPGALLVAASHCNK